MLILMRSIRKFQFTAIPQHHFLAEVPVRRTSPGVGVVSDCPFQATYLVRHTYFSPQMLGNNAAMPTCAIRHLQATTHPSHHDATA